MWKRRNGRRIRVLLDANNDGAGGWEWWDNNTGDSGTSKDDSGKKEDEGKKTPDNVPYDRFKEVNDANKAMKAKLAEYEKKEAEEAEKKRLADEEEAKKKGEFEKLLTQKDQEIAEYKKQSESWKEREDIVSKRNQERMSALEKSLGDKWGTAKSLIDDINDPFKLSSKLDSLESIYANWWSQSKSSGGSNMPSGWKDTSRLADLQDRANKGEYLTPWETQEMLRLAREKRSEK